MDGIISAISKLIPSFMDIPVIGKRLRDVILLVYAAHAFDDCWKLSLNILYFLL